MYDPIFQYKGLVFDQAEGEFKTLQEFLSVSAENLVKEHTEYTDFNDRQQRDYHPAYLDAMYLADGDYIDVYLEGLGKYGITFPRILLYSIIIMACSSFESNMKLIYKVMNHFNTSNLKWENVKGNVVDKTIKLLNDIDLHVEDEKEKMNEFRNYISVRNCVVHNNGEIQDYRYRDILLPYVTDKGLILDDVDEPVLELNREYCDDVLNTFIFFFADLSINYSS
jgi:hypothetical protein